MGDGAAILDDLDARGLIHDTTDRAELASRLASGSTTLYHGIDPSADSLHIGNFVGVLMLRRFQDAGHFPLVLIGGATGMIGDPGGRSEERNLLDEEQLAANMAGIRKQLERLVDSVERQIELLALPCGASLAFQPRHFGAHPVDEGGGKAVLTVELAIIRMAHQIKAAGQAQLIRQDFPQTLREGQRKIMHDPDPAALPHPIDLH